MDGPTLVSRLRRLCTALDEGRPPESIPWQRVLAPLAAPAIVGGAMLLGGCPDPPEVMDIYGAPFAEICTDGMDNDGDGQVDCADPQCVGQPPCGNTPAGHPEICDDGGDNDGDGLTDCADPVCARLPVCAGSQPAPIYGAPPMPTEVCGDGLDNDGNGLMDCADPACSTSPPCVPLSPQISLYGAPPMSRENCSNGRDDDRDGRVDCADEECASDSACAAVPAYGVPPMDHPTPTPQPRYRAPVPR